MSYPDDLPTIYDEIIENRNYCSVNGTTIPIRESVVDELTDHIGETEIHLRRADGTSRTVTGDGPIPPRKDLLQSLLAAQCGFNENPLSTLTNLFGARFGPFHYTDSTAHYAVSEDIFSTPSSGTSDGVPEQFLSLGVKAAHLLEGFEIDRALPHHWASDAGWRFTQMDYVRVLEENDLPEDLAPPLEECFILNVPIRFPAASFGRATGAPSQLVNEAIVETERTLDNTLLTQRMAQMRSVEVIHFILETAITKGHVDTAELDDIDSVFQATFDITEPELASLRSQADARRHEAFETVRLLSDSTNFDIVMDEFAETLDDLGELAILGTKYREEVLGKNPGLY